MQQWNLATVGTKKSKVTEAAYDDFELCHRSGGNISRTAVHSLVRYYYINRNDTWILSGKQGNDKKRLPESFFNDLIMEINNFSLNGWGYLHFFFNLVYFFF